MVITILRSVNEADWRIYAALMIREGGNSSEGSGRNCLGLTCEVGRNDRAAKHFRKKTTAATVESADVDDGVQTS